jgi:hypothetical protein
MIALNHRAIIGISGIVVIFFSMNFQETIPKIVGVILGLVLLFKSIR